MYPISTIYLFLDFKKLWDKKFLNIFVLCLKNILEVKLLG